MKPFSSRATFLALALSAAPFLSCHASHFEDTQEILKVNTSTICLSAVPSNDLESAALVCKSWYGAYQKLMPSRLRDERHFMLHDLHHWSATLSSGAAQPLFAQIFKEDDFVFVPFGHGRFPDNSAPLSDADVAPLALSLYTKAFQETKEELTPQDKLCLKAVLPWQRMFVSSNNATAKVKALESLGRVCPNPDLVRFSNTLVPETLADTQKTIVLSSDELLAKDADDFLASQSDHLIHVIVEKESSVKHGVTHLVTESFQGVRHLILSDPQGAVTYTNPTFLNDAKSLTSLTLRNFEFLEKILLSFCANCPSLTFFEMRGTSRLNEVDPLAFLEKTPFKAEPARFQTLYNTLEKRIGKKLASIDPRFYGELYNRSIQ